MPVDPSALDDIEPKSPIESATRLRRILGLWPWAWLAFAGVITRAWAIALGCRRRSEAQRYIREALSLTERYGSTEALARANALARRLGVG